MSGLQRGMPPHMMNGMMQQQQMLQMQHMMQAANMPQRHRDAPESEPSAKRPRLDLGSNQGTSLLEAFSAAEIQTHLAMLRSRPGQYICHGLVMCLLHAVGHTLVLHPRVYISTTELCVLRRLSEQLDTLVSTEKQ